LRRSWIALVLFLLGVTFVSARYYYDFVAPLRLFPLPPEVWATPNRTSDVALLFFGGATVILWGYGTLDFIIGTVRRRATVPRANSQP
jgi:hypothetical protein